jgi:hypothetical protein
MSIETMFSTSEIVILSALLLLFVLMIFFHIQAHSSDCSGRLVSRTKAPDGQICTKEARLSIHDHEHEHV